MYVELPKGLYRVDFACFPARFEAGVLVAGVLVARVREPEFDVAFFEAVRPDVGVAFVVSGLPPKA